jgi:hypothetical protein
MTSLQRSNKPAPEGKNASHEHGDVRGDLEEIGETHRRKADLAGDDGLLSQVDARKPRTAPVAPETKE